MCPPSILICVAQAIAPGQHFVDWIQKQDAITVTSKQTVSYVRQELGPMDDPHINASAAIKDLPGVIAVPIEIVSTMHRDRFRAQFKSDGQLIATLQRDTDNLELKPLRQIPGNVCATAELWRNWLANDASEAKGIAEVIDDAKYTTADGDLARPVYDNIVNGHWQRRRDFFRMDNDGRLIHWRSE